ncbi:cytochrome c oxidase subunit I [Pseudidiomarina terrestris]|uniref:cytochrome c oxidase subunit I n=1 Tax=Pseudidiomarina terrestris TaxID=2820060 RepID=UPI00264F3A76|nr:MULTISPECIES: cytochrome c oxidase subunit I [unclassified Pseudidiomarina]MDN7128077.1 cytochrome c oxidase subunit I [Pseudidiomarina sp. 1APR75-33.1]MDN7135759.1 cytochrome c oxidase subunit I [Pseudidiomarina sp. 1ASP75-5]
MTEQEALHQRFNKVWRNLPGWGSLAAVNHTSVGRRFMLTGAIFFLIGGLLALLIRMQLALPGQEFLNPDVYSQVFTMHGTVMMFLFAIPILEGAAIYLIPKMIGARDLIFPRLGALGYYCYLFGGIIVISSLLLGMAPSSGWFMYTPLSSTEFSPGPGSDFWLLGITFVEISSVSAGIELVVAILRSRTPGMTLSKMPIFCWYILVTALMIVFGFPPLILASILLELERAAGMPFFDVAAGGDPVLWQHLFWLFGHPEVYIIFLPAAGIVSTILPVFTGRPLVGYRWVVMAVILTGFISFGLWAHHMFTVGIPQLAQAFFSMASMLVAIPTAIQVFAWLATLWAGRVVYSLPMLWVFGFLFVFVLGGLTGVMLAMVPFNWQVHDTHFVVAHLHYVLVGGMLFPLIGGLYYWLPHFSGRMPSERLGRWGFGLVFVGFNATFFLMHLTGLLGMPRRVDTYETGLGWDWLNMLSSVGSFVIAMGVAIIIIDVLLHFRFGRKAGNNPWNADTLEWTTGTPPTMYNFASLPEINSRHPLWDNPELLQSIPAGEHGLTQIEHGRRETFGTDAITGKLKEVMLLPTNSWLPLLVASSLAVVCISLLTRSYLAAVVITIVAAIFLFRWSWENGGHPLAAPLGDKEPVEAPLQSRTLDGSGLWGMVITLLADGALFLALLFGWLYLWAVAPNWTLPDESLVSLPVMAWSGAFLTFATWWYCRAVKQLKAGDDTGLQTRFWVVTAAGAIHLVLLVGVTLVSPLAITELAHDAVLLVMLMFLIFHSSISVIATALQALRVRYGYVSKELPYEPVVLQPLWLFSLATFWCSVASFLLLPIAWGAA